MKKQFAAVMSRLTALPMGLLLAVSLAMLVAGCATPMPWSPPPHVPVFEPAVKSDNVVFPTREALAEIEADVEPVFRIGSGDVLSVQVWGRPELSGRHIVGPDGIITVPVSGPVKVGTFTREEAARQVRDSLLRYYIEPSVNFTIDQYTSNRVTVLGRVQNPGQLSFDNSPTLLEVLAKAGSLPVIDKQATLTRCAIFRGRDKIIWVDLKGLLNGGRTYLNLRMKPGDLVYIPDSSDTMVYVLGAVSRPGAYRLTPDMSVMDALATAGGPNEDAQPDEIAIYRPGRRQVETIKLQYLMDGFPRVNFALEEGDVIFVPKSNIAEFGYYTRQLAAGLSFISVGAAVGWITKP